MIAYRVRLSLVFLVASVATGLFGGGCKKSNSGESRPNPDSAVVLLTPADLKPDGTISDAGLKKVSDQSGAPGVTVSFLRANLTDAGLEQLAKFPNVTRVEAAGSKLTPAGIEKFKAANPKIEVIR